MRKGSRNNSDQLRSPKKSKSAFYIVLPCVGNNGIYVPFNNTGSHKPLSEAGLGFTMINQITFERRSINRGIGNYRYEAKGNC